MSDSKKNNLSLLSFIGLWFGASISIAEIMTGGLLAPLGFKNGLIAILLGHLLGTGILVLGGIIGTEERLPSIMSTRISFGLYGSYLFSIFNVLQLIGWTSVMIISGARSVNLISISLWSFDSTFFWSILIGGLVCLWILLGKRGLGKLSIIAAGLLFLLTIVLSLVVFGDGQLLSGKASGEMSFGAGLELSIIMPLSWLPLIADYTRFAKNKKIGASGSFIGYFVGSSWMYIIGLGAAILAQNPDPGAMMLAADLGFAALGVVVLSTITTTFLDAYSAGVTFLNLFPKLDEKKVALTMGILGSLIALVFPIESYESFLYALGSVFAPMFAILLTDYFIIKKSRKLQNNLLVNWGAAFVWIFGVFAYYRFIEYDFIFGATLPVMLVTGFVYSIAWRWISNWKYSKEPEISCQ